MDKKTMMTVAASVGGLVVLALAGWLLYDRMDLSDKLPWAKDETEIVICEGSVCEKNLSDKTTKMLIYKGDYDSVEEFVEVNTSPDGDKICILAQSLVPMWLYTANADGTDVEAEIALAENCVWSHDSSKVAFTNHTTDVSPHNVFVYDFALEKTTNYTAEVNDLINMRVYEKPVWADDDSTLTSKYKAYDESWNETSGESEINLDTGEIREI